MIKVSVIIPVYNQEKLLIRALESVPKRDDVEIIVINDGSTDNSYNNAVDWAVKNGRKNFSVWNNSENRGVAYTVNRGYDLAQGEYIVLLGSDDYFYTDKFEEIMTMLDGTDLIYFNLEINDGTVWHLIPETKTLFCGSVKFMRRDFIGNTRNPEDKRAGEDSFFYQDLLKKNPSEIFTNITAKHYNFPRIGSLTNTGGKNP